MKHIALSAAAVVALSSLLTACPPKPAEQALPPSGLAGVPSTSIPISPNATMPAGHPDIGGHDPSMGGDDGAPLPTKGAPLPNFGTPTGDSVGAGAGGMGAGAGVVFTGKVVEKLEVPSYTYMRVATTDGDQWVAVSTMSVNVGDVVTINQQIVMNNFPSKSLNRTFEKLIMGTATIGG